MTTPPLVVAATATEAAKVCARHGLDPRRSAVTYPLAERRLRGTFGRRVCHVHPGPLRTLRPGLRAAMLRFYDTAELARVEWIVEHDLGVLA